MAGDDEAGVPSMPLARAVGGGDRLGDDVGLTISWFEVKRTGVAENRSETCLMERADGTANQDTPGGRRRCGEGTRFPFYRTGQTGLVSGDSDQFRRRMR